MRRRSSIERARLDMRGPCAAFGFKVLVWHGWLTVVSMEIWKSRLRSLRGARTVVYTSGQRLWAGLWKIPMSSYRAPDQEL